MGIDRQTPKRDFGDRIKADVNETEFKKLSIADLKAIAEQCNALIEKTDKANQVRLTRLAEIHNKCIAEINQKIIEIFNNPEDV